MPITTAPLRLAMGIFFLPILKVGISILGATNREALRNCEGKLYAFHQINFQSVKHQTATLQDTRYDGG